MPPSVRMLLTRVSVAASMTSTAPAPPTMATYTRLPSLLTAMLFGWLVSGTCLVMASVFASATSTVDSASLVMYSRLPSGAAATPWFTSIPLISPTTLLVAGSISMTLSPAALVWTMRTVAAAAPRLAATANPRIRESLVFIATHSKLPGHVVDLLFCPPGPGGPGARFRRVQGQRPAAADRKAPRPRPVHHLSLDGDRLPPDPAAAGPPGLYGRGVAQELRGGEPDGPSRRTAQEPPSHHAARARSRRHRVPSGRQALGFADRS